MIVSLENPKESTEKLKKIRVQYNWLDVINTSKLRPLVNDDDDQLEILMEKDSIHSIIKYSKFNYHLKVQYVCK